MIVAIHQPNFFPWLGYFRKMLVVDCFVFLDTVQFSKGSWINRSRLCVSGHAHWVSCPIRRLGSELAIRDTRINDHEPWRKKFKRSIEVSYAGAPHFAEAIDCVKELIDFPSDSLADFNINAVSHLAKRLNIRCDLIRASDLLPSDNFGLGGSAMLAEICARLGADVYLAGDGAAGYERVEEYKQRGIALRHNGFRCLPYRQHGVPDFLPGLSLLDALFCTGFEGTRRLIAYEDAAAAENGH